MSLLLMEEEGESLCCDAAKALTSRTVIYKMSVIDCQR